MWMIGTFVCVFVGHFVAAQSVLKEQDAKFPPSFPGFFENFMHFPFERNFDFAPYDTIFSSWRTRAPDFHMLAELPPIIIVPRIQVFCDESQLTLLVDKASNGVMFTAEEIQLGDGCYRTTEQPNQFIFTYSINECGTKREVQNGLKIFTNSLHLHLKKPLPNWWQTPSTLQITCIPKRSHDDPGFFDSVALSENSKRFSINAMNPSWTSATQSNIYKRGQVVNLQVSAKTRPSQQLFIQSCSVSASPEPQTKPRHSVIMNKGCTAPLGSPHPVVQFVASSRGDVVNFVLNTSYLISELYVHCSVLVSDQGVTSGSKSCNYNLIQSRWEDLGGDTEVCECCSAKCKGPIVRQFPEDAKAMVSTGPFVIVNEDTELSSEPDVSEPQETLRAADSMLSDAPVMEDTVVSGTPESTSEFPSPLQGVVVVSRDPVARLTMWLPGQAQDTEHSNNVDSESEDSLTVQSKAGDTESNNLNQIDFNQMGFDLVQMQADAAAVPVPQEGTNNIQPVSRSKLQFAKGRDGSQTLSYEEEVVRQQEGKGATRGCGMDWLKRKQGPQHKGLRSTFLDLLRRMDRAE